MPTIPDDVQPYAALQDGVDQDGTYESFAAVGDDFAPGATEDGDRNA